MSAYDLLAEQAGYKLVWARIEEKEYIDANISGFHGDDEAMEKIFAKITAPLSKEIQQKQSLLSEPAKTSLLEYLQLFNKYQQIAERAVNHFDKPDEKVYREAAKADK